MEELKTRARKLESALNDQMTSLSMMGGPPKTLLSRHEDSAMEPLLPLVNGYEESVAQIESLLTELSDVNEKMSEIANNTPGKSVTSFFALQNHREFLQNCTQEFRKTQETHRARKEREELLQSVRKDIDLYRGSSGLSRRTDIYLKEHEHIKGSDKMVQDQINIAVEMRDHLVTQRISMKRFQTRLHTLSNRFPIVNSLVQRINIKNRKDSIILGFIIAVCVMLMLAYMFH